MAKLIDTQKALEIVRFECGEWTGLAKTIENRFNELPSVEAEPVRHGKWERHYIRPGVFANLYWHCSCCGGKLADEFANHYKYCPDCGARMDEGRE